MLYSDRVQLTGNTADDTDGAGVVLTLNGKARRILYVWGELADATRTAAEGRQSSLFLTGDIGEGGSPRPLIPIGTQRGSSLGGTIDEAVANPTFYPVDWKTSGNAEVTMGLRGIGGTAAQLAEAGLIYSDGEGHPQVGSWNSHGLRAPPKWVISTDDTAVTATTTETALAPITVPGNARMCVGLGVGGARDGVLVTAEEVLTTVRWTATGANVPNGQFDPAQIWPIPGNAFDAGLSTVIHGPSGGPVEFMPLQFGVTKNSTLTPLVTFRTAVTNAYQFRGYAAFI